MIWFRRIYLVRKLQKFYKKNTISDRVAKPNRLGDMQKSLVGAILWVATVLVAAVLFGQMQGLFNLQKPTNNTTSQTTTPSPTSPPTQTPVPTNRPIPTQSPRPNPSPIPTLKPTATPTPTHPQPPNTPHI